MGWGEVIGETYGTDESLVLLEVVVLKSNVKLASLLHDLSELVGTFADGLVVNLSCLTFLIN